MSIKQRTMVRFNKKNDGQEISIDFSYTTRAQMTTADKMRVEMWVRQQGTLLLHAFKMQFPETIS